MKSIQTHSLLDGIMKRTILEKNNVHNMTSDNQNTPTRTHLLYTDYVNMM
jgi:hypothetical protein